ncbi:hypothetical protein [Thioclava sp. GXIMD4216]|uniref:Protease inhibitor Inh n=1 Tax=Thioclava litoralis TaxID=3076557 RepID=A0ABZ1E2G1_9RHOB|nr:hypothetical protein RPE78_02275 [Thioclava sp. FTW29]
MKYLIGLGLALGLAACAQTGWKANPQGVTLHGEQLAVSFFNGEVCRVTMGGAHSGTLSNCSNPLHYEVRIESHPLVPAASAILQTQSTVVLSNGAGRTWTFHTPSLRDTTGDNVDPPMALH